MRKSDFTHLSGIVVLMLLVAYSSYRVVGVFFGLSIAYSSYIFAIMGLVAASSLILVSTVGSVPLGKTKLIFWAIVFSIVFSLLVQWIAYGEVIDSNGFSSVKFPQFVFLTGLVWMLCGACVQRLRIAKSPLLAICTVAFLAVAIYSASKGELVISYSSLAETRSDNLELSHLVVGESSVFLLALAFALTPVSLRPFVSAAAIVLLFSLGGRTALFTYIIAWLLYLILMRSLSRAMFYLGLAGIVVLVAVLFSGIDLNDSAVGRMLLVGGVEADESVQARDALLLEGLRLLPKQFFVGNPGLLIENSGGLGTYIHNLLSSWQFFGFLPFFLFLCSVIIIFVYIFRIRRRLAGSVDDFGVFLFLIAAVSILTAKSIIYFHFWFVIGFWLFRISESPRHHLVSYSSTIHSAGATR